MGLKHKVRLAVVLASLLALSACSEMANGTGQISKRIGDVVHDPSSKVVDLAQLTTFGWDHFYVFKAGTPREDICRFMGAKRNVCGRIIRYPNVPQDAMTLVFSLDGQLTHTELHAIANGDLDLPFRADGYAKQDCVFTIRRTSLGADRDPIRLELR